MNDKKLNYRHKSMKWIYQGMKAWFTLEIVYGTQKILHISMKVCQQIIKLKFQMISDFLTNFFLIFMDSPATWNIWSLILTYICLFVSENFDSNNFSENLITYTSKFQARFSLRNATLFSVFGFTVNNNCTYRNRKLT